MTIARMPIASMKKVSDLLETLERRDKDRQDYMILNPADHNFRFTRGNPDLGTPDRLLMEFDGQDLELSNGAIASGCKMLKTSVSYFQDNFSDWQTKFVRDFSSAMNHNQKGCFARTDCLSNGTTRRIESFVSGNWQLRVGESDIVRGVAERLNAQYGDSILGVQHIHEGHRNSVYRFVFGDTIMGDDNNIKMYPMVSLLHSPYGFSNTELSLGIYRVICENGALRRDFSAGVARWNQRSNPESFFGKIRDAVDNAGDFAKTCKDHFYRMVDEKIGHHPLIVLRNLREAKAISQPHLETAIQFLAERDVSTEYDMLNLLTDSAKTVRPLQARQDAESNALRIAMTVGGFGGYANSSRVEEMEFLL